MDILNVVYKLYQNEGKEPTCKMKIRIGVLFGGQSAEYEVSIRSAKSVIEHLDPDKYDVFPIGIDKKGHWLFLNKDRFLLSIKQNHLPTLEKKDPHFPLMIQKVYAKEIVFSPCILREMLDVVFPMLHGPNGEDGSVQGLIQLANLPYVGSNILSSAICMDKVVMKALLKSAGLPILRYTSLHCTDLIDADTIIADLKLPLFVKPANLGSSIGINKIHTKKEFWPFVREAFMYDEYILIEESFEGRELECSILGNFDPIASLPGEIFPSHEFYSYEAKYLDSKGAEFKLPAKLDPQIIQEIQELGIRAYKVLRCEGMARIDFFLKKSGEIVINELNTIPGFTPISLYPKLWEISGISYSELLDRLISLAIKRFKRRQALKTVYSNKPKQIFEFI